MPGGTIRLKCETAAVRAKLTRIQRALKSKARQRAVNAKAAGVWLPRMVRRTPKRWTGQTRRQWKIINEGESAVALTNVSKVMLWLECGTKAHGPVSARALFIPFTRRAAEAGARGVIAANRYADLKVAFGVKGARRKPPFVPGVDFVWAKRVKGVRASHMIEESRPMAMDTLRIIMREEIAKIIA